MNSQIGRPKNIEFHGQYTPADDVGEKDLWKYLCYTLSDRNRRIIEQDHRTLCPLCEAPCKYGIRWMQKEGLEHGKRENAG